MAGSARRDVATARLRPRRVTAETSGVRIEIRGNRHGHTAAYGTMTGGAVDAAHREMLRVIELHAKANQPIGKWFHRA